MRHDRLGSYSMAATLAGTPSLLRRKSTTRYRCLGPPPRWRAVLRPWTLRPPVAGFLSTSDRSGRLRVSSEKSATVWNRRPGLVGLRLRSAIAEPRLSVLEQVDRIALDEGDDRPLGVGTPAVGERAPVAVALAGPVGGVHLGDPDAEDLLYGVADLWLGGVGVDRERVHARLHEGVRLLAHDGGDDDVAGAGHLLLPSVVSASVVSAGRAPGSDARVKTTQSLTSTS